MRIFAALSPKQNPLFHISTTKYLEHINLCSPLTPLWKEIDMYDHWLFCTQFNSQQLLFEAFLDMTRIFVNIKP